MKKKRPSSYQQTQAILTTAVKAAMVKPVSEIVKPKKSANWENGDSQWMN